MSAWYAIKAVDGQHLANINIKEGDENTAIAKYINSQCQPIWCKLHDEMPEDRRSGPVGTMGFYQPRIPKIGKAVRMKENYLNGGMFLLPA